MKAVVKNIILISLITVVLLEVVLRITGLYRTFGEKWSGSYNTPYGEVQPTWYYTWSANEPIIYQQPEIKCSYPANSLGIREKELTPNKPDSIMRILFLGDSFTEGDGAPYDSTMPRFLEKILIAQHANVQVYNAGVCGSDPFYSYTFYRDKLLRYEFDKVILCINNSDIDEVGVRGDSIRFMPDSTTRYKAPPWYAGLYRYSHVVRMMTTEIFHRNENFMKITADPQYFRPLLQQMEVAVAQTEKLSRQRQAEFICVIHPFPFSFEKEFAQWKHIRLIKTQLDTAGIAYVDLYPAFEEALKGKNHLDYGWALNRHFNARGYELYAHLLYKEIADKYPGYWE